MRPSIAVAFVLVVSPAYAGSKSGSSGGGGGRLGQVSGGIGAATGAGSSSGARSGSDDGNAESTLYGQCVRYREARERDHRFRNVWYDEQCRDIVVVATTDGPKTTPGVVAGSPPTTATFHGFAAAQKVYESDASLSVALAVVDRRFRLDGGLTHYYEDQMEGGRITMTMPWLTFGVRLGQDPTTQLWVEGGVMNAKTKGDPNGNSTITGPVVGLRLEHQLSNKLTLIGTANGMAFEDSIRAFGGRAGVRWGHVEAAFRVLDFNVGPALFGPEVGVGF